MANVFLSFSCKNIKNVYKQNKFHASRVVSDGSHGTYRRMVFESVVMQWDCKVSFLSRRIYSLYIKNWVFACRGVFYSLLEV